MTTYPPTSPVYGWPLLQGSAQNDWRHVDDSLLAVEQTVQSVSAGALSVATADLRYVAKAGDVMTGMLTVSPYAVAPQFLVSGPAGTPRIVSFGQFGVANRWYLYATGDAETGSDAGTNLAIDRYSDAGAASRVLTVTRATGNALFGGDVTAS